MKNEKSVIEWLLEAKENDYHWADAAIENCKNDDLYAGNEDASSLSEALGGAFRWGKTKEGLGYWAKKCDELIEKGL